MTPPGEILAASHAALDRRDWRGAAQGYLDVLARQPENIEARAGLATCVLVAGDESVAQAAGEDIDRLHAAVAAFRELACALAHAGQPAKAKRLLECVLRLPGGQAGFQGVPHERWAPGWYTASLSLYP